jgi:hypothetical protein
MFIGHLDIIFCEVTVEGFCAIGRLGCLAFISEELFCFIFWAGDQPRALRLLSMCCTNELHHLFREFFIFWLWVLWKNINYLSVWSLLFTHLVISFDARCIEILNFDEFQFINLMVNNTCILFENSAYPKVMEIL